MNDQKQVTFDPKMYNAWRNLAAAIATPSVNASSADLASLTPASRMTVRRPNHE